MAATDFVAGWVSGGVGLLAGHPFDTVKTRLQTVAGYNGMFDCISKTVKQESIAGLYRGMFLPFVSAGAVNSLLFAGYGLTLKLLHPNEANVRSKDLPMSEIMLASFCGTMCQLPVMVPVEAIKTKLQAQNDAIKSGIKRKVSFEGPWQCARHVMKTEGFRGLYRGANMVTVREAVSSFFYIPLYEVCLKLLKDNSVNETMSQFLAGGTAGVACWITVCPLEVVKNRVLVHAGSKNGRELFRKVYREEGVRTFFRGGLALSVYGFLTNAALFMVYEKCYAFLENLDVNKRKL